MTNTESISNPRNNTLDILRGLAIFTMILSNFAGEMLKAPHPFILRIIGSLAAPLFVIIAGFLVGHAVKNKNYPLSYFLIRGFLTLFIASIVDIFVWNSYPFISVDVLYLTGLAIPITALYMKFNRIIKILLIVFIFALAIYLKSYLGYAEKPNFPPIWKEGKFIPFAGELSLIFNHWIVDGWFPIFPWIGIAFTGGLLAEIKKKREFTQNRDFGKIFFLGFLFLVLGILFWNHEFRYEMRGNYTELFYPPTLSYFSAYLGGIFFLYLLVDINPSLKIYSPLRLLGISPLFFYFIHFLLISKTIAPFFGKTGDKEIYLEITPFLISYLVIILLCLFLALLISLFKKRFPNLPFIIKFFIGG